MTEHATFEDEFHLDGASIRLRFEYGYRPGIMGRRDGFGVPVEPDDPSLVDIGKAEFWAEAAFGGGGRWRPVGKEGWAILCQLGLTEQMREAAREEWESGPDPDALYEAHRDKREAADD